MLKWHFTLLTAAIPGYTNCVESTAARSTCTVVDQELYTLTTTAANGGASCTGSSTKCVQGDLPINCDESTAARSTCTAIDQELYTLTTGAAYGGTACTGSSTKCVPGDGNIPIVPLTDGDDTVDGSLKKAVIHPGSRGGGPLESTDVVAVFPRTIIILHSYVESPVLRDSHPSRFCVPPGTESSPDQNKMKDCLVINPSGDCGSLVTYGLPETWDTSQVTDTSFRALPRTFTREGISPTVVAWFLSSVGPRALWTVGGLRPVVWVCDGVAQCFALGHPATIRVGQTSTSPSDYGTCPR